MGTTKEFYDCCFCLKRLYSLTDLQRHIGDFHEHTCPFCDVVFVSVEDVHNHMDEVHPQNLHSCPFCSFATSNFTLLTYHIEYGHRFSEKITDVQESSSTHNKSEQATKVSEDKNTNSRCFSKNLETKLDTLAANKCLEEPFITAKKNVNSAFKSLDHQEKQRLLAEFSDQMKTPVDLGFCKTPGIPEAARDARLPSYSVERIFVKSCDHYSSNVVYCGWACGFKNFQMLLSSLLTDPLYKSVLVSKGLRKVPSIFAIQDMIENAWNNGFDPDGAREFGNRLMGTTRWIGAVEIYTCLAYLGIKSKLSDFKMSGEGSIAHMFEWISRHFEDNTRQIHPLYLQHSGHSRTIIGVEKKENVCTSLFLFDPSMPMKEVAKVRADPEKNLNFIRKTPAAFVKPVYQILTVCNVFKSTAEIEEHKKPKSTPA